MRALTLVILRDEALLDALARAETDDAALQDAARLIDELPPRPRRRLLATYSALGAPPPRRRQRKRPIEAKA
jgi:hypothetical protein